MTQFDCDDLLERLWAYMDGEVDSAACDDLRAHIERCLPCRQHAEFERRLREIIQYKCRGERAPEALRFELVRMIVRSP
jgi:mycothiol system anti-sigma-R factor